MLRHPVCRDGAQPKYYGGSVWMQSTAVSVFQQSFCTPKRIDAFGPPHKARLHLPWLIWNYFSPSLQNGLPLFGFLVFFRGQYWVVSWYLHFWKGVSCVPFPMSSPVLCVGCWTLHFLFHQVGGGKQRGKKKGRLDPANLLTGRLSREAPWLRSQTFYLWNTCNGSFLSLMTAG